MEKYLYEDLYNIEDSHWWHISKRKTVLYLIKKLVKPKAPKILDMGCGTGKNVEALSNIGNVFGIDNSSEAIKYCHKRGLKNISFASIYKTPFQKSSFDLITILDVLEHTQEAKTLKEIHRLTKKDGYVVITVPAYSWLWSQWDVIQHHKRRYTQKDLKNVLEISGFKILKISYMFSFLVIPIVLVRIWKSIFFNKNYPSDFKLTSKILDKLLIGVCDFERWLLGIFNIPFGTSIVCVAKKI